MKIKSWEDKKIRGWEDGKRGNEIKNDKLSTWERASSASPCEAGRAARENRAWKGSPLPKLL